MREVRQTPKMKGEKNVIVGDTYHPEPYITKYTSIRGKKSRNGAIYNVVKFQILPRHFKFLTCLQIYVEDQR